MWYPLIFVSVVLAALTVVSVQRKVSGKNPAGRIVYEVTLSTNEIFEGDDFYLTETITNNAPLPIRCVRIDTMLPAGLEFVINRDGGKVSAPYISGIFTVGGRKSIQRKWLIHSVKRGKYTIDYSITVSGDMLGTAVNSEKMAVPKTRNNTITVLPCTIPLEHNFTSSRYLTGDEKARHKLVSDPLRITGAREYSPDDPFNKINWKLSAVHDRLLVNTEEFTEKSEMNILLNMQSRSRELHENIPSGSDFTEMCITVAASIIDEVSVYDIPVSVITNGHVTDDYEVEEKIEFDAAKYIVRTLPAASRLEFLRQMRLLASIEDLITCPAGDMIALISKNPYEYLSSRNVVIISPYFDSFMADFHKVMKSSGIDVVYYITTHFSDTLSIPSDAEIYFKSHRGTDI